MMSNALPYAVALGRIAGRCAALDGRRHGTPDPDPSEIERILLRAESPRDRSRKLETSEATGMLHDIMATHGGYGRTKEGLEQALGADVPRPTLHVRRSTSDGPRWTFTCT